MSLRIPVTATNLPEWVRRAANAVNSLIEARVATDGRLAALETFTATPFTLDSVTLRPVSLPGSPVKGMTVYDIADDKVKTYDGTAWQTHY